MAMSFNANFCSRIAVGEGSNADLHLYLLPSTEDREEILASRTSVEVSFCDFAWNHCRIAIN